MPRQLKEGDVLDVCPKCKTHRLVVRRNRSTNELFVGCSGYPSCRHTIREDDYHDGGDYSWVK